ncbi:hypothetical protein B0A53_00009 [Rhodotorula sp. CCFEE 5036]|nr:hypothetical protein B0A53_00009 [Rhodotorula sp. CCFEE 5036]
MEREPAIIHRLPDELLHAILSFLALDHSELDLNALKAASLVHSSWRDSAQRFIWQAGAELVTPTDVDAFIRTRDRRRCGPSELAVHAHTSTKQLVRLFDACRDGQLQMLMIAAPTRDLDPAVLQHPNLKHLRQLILQGWFVATPASTVQFPFKRLESLVAHDLTPRGRSSLHHFLSALSTSNLDALSSISLPSIAGPLAAETIAQALVPLAPKLKHLGLSLNDRVASTEAHFIPVFEAAATSLYSFECTTLPYALLPHLPTSLRVLATMEEAADIHPTHLIDVVFVRCPNLERLYFACERREIMYKPRGTEAILLARERGIDWRFAGEHDDDDDE